MTEPKIFESLKRNLPQAYGLIKVKFEKDKPVDFDVADFNDRFAEFFGIKTSEITKKPAKEIIAKSAPNLLNNFVDSTASGVPNFLEMTSPVTKKKYSTKIFAPGENYCAILIDIEKTSQEKDSAQVTDQGQKTEIIKEFDELSNVFDKTSIGVFFMMLDEPVEWNDQIDKDATINRVFETQRITRINQAMLDQYKAKRDDFIGLTPKDFFEFDIDYGKAVWKRFFNEGKLHIETYEKKFDGDDMFVLGDYICLFDGEGGIIGHFGMQIDITEQKNLEAERTESVARYEQLAVQSRSYAWEVDKNGLYVYVGDSVEKVLGYRPDELIGKVHFYDLHPENDREDFKNAAFEVFNRKDPFKDLENDCLTKDGRKIWVSTNGLPLIDSDGSLRGYAGTDTDITERKESEEQVSMLAEIIDISPSGISIHYPDGEIAYVNDSFSSMHGRTKESLISSRLYDLIELEDKSIIDKRLKILKEKGEALFEATHYKSDGSTFPLDVYVKQIQWRGKPALLSVIVDISERKEYNRKIEEKNQRLLNIVEGTRAGTWEWNVQTGETRFNERWANIVGYSLEELEPISIKTWEKLAHPEDLIKSGEALQKHFAGESDYYEFESRMKHKDGRWIWVIDRGKVVSRTETGEPLMMFGTHMDISGRKESEEELAASKERFSKMGDSALDAVILINEKGVTEYWNPGAEQMLGFKSEEMIGKKVHDFIMPKKYFERFRKGWKNYLVTGDGPLLGIINEFWALKKDGSEIPVELSLAKMNIHGKNWTSAFIRDISRRKMAEKQLIKAKEQAESANRAKSEFLANMSHEIRTPLNSILGFSEVMLGTVDNGTDRKYLKTIHGSGKTLLNLINEILDLSKIESGKLDVRSEFVDLRSLIDEIGRIFSQIVLEKGLNFVIDIDPNFPRTVSVDEIRIRQILLNLIGNAIKFTSVGFVKVELKIIEQKSSSVDYAISISDSGIGITDSVLDNIFDSFVQRSGHDSKKYGGTGLGLTISKKLAELMNGRIKVESELDVGSKFTVELFEAAYSDAIVDQNKSKSVPEEVIFKGSKILVVDDLADNRELILSFLTNCNLRFFEAENGEEALKIAAAETPDLILTDIRMPVMDGYEAARLIKSCDSTKHIPIVAVTASVMKSDSDAIDKYFDGFLRKPIQRLSLWEELLKKLPHDKIQAPTKKDETDLAESIKPTPESVKKEFRDSFFDKIEENKEMVIIGSIEKLADEFSEFAEKNDLSALAEITATLRNRVESFDIPGIDESLGYIRRMFD